MQHDNYFLDIHNSLLEKGKLPDYGLCGTINQHNDVFGLFSPSSQDFNELRREGLDDDYWASGLKYTFSTDNTPQAFAYTPLRQTIILFCHEILNSEV